MKIISNKQWEKMNQSMVDLQLDLNKSIEDNQTYYSQVEYLRKRLEDERENNTKLGQLIEKLSFADRDNKLLIKNLKTLLTKYNIDYSHILKNKKEKKNVRTTNKNN